jgi:hypothetical protein
MQSGDAASEPPGTPAGVERDELPVLPAVVAVEHLRELLSLVKDKSVVLEEYATRMVAAEAVHIREMGFCHVSRRLRRSVQAR